MRLRRAEAGRYETRDGVYEIVSAHAGGGGRGWHIFDIETQMRGEDGYITTESTLKEARAALEGLLSSP